MTLYLLNQERIANEYVINIKMFGGIEGFAYLCTLEQWFI